MVGHVTGDRGFFALRAGAHADVARRVSRGSAPAIPRWSGDGPARPACPGLHRVSTGATATCIDYVSLRPRASSFSATITSFGKCTSLHRVIEFNDEPGQKRILWLIRVPAARASEAVGPAVVPTCPN
jgi:hypothetical protein